jgi:uncharacterized protein YndB with AHSA1/START domain
VINCDGKEVTIQGEYREIIPGNKIVFTWKHCNDELWKMKTASSRWNSRIAIAEPNYD